MSDLRQDQLASLEVEQPDGMREDWDFRAKTMQRTYTDGRVERFRYRIDRAQPIGRQVILEML